MKINFFASIGGRWISAANDPLCLKNVALPQWLRVSLCALWLFVASLLGAQGFSFDDCMLPTGTALFGSGAPNGTIADDGTGTNCVLHLTEAGQSSSWGAFLIPDQAAGNNVDHITVRWRSLIGGGGGGADGYSFNWATDLPNPPSYGNPGEEGAGTGLSVTVDTFDNGCADCATGTDTGLEIKWRGARVAYLHTDKSFLRKGQFVDAEANVDTSGAATFTYDGITISAQLAGWTGIAGGSYMFGARTGGANDNQWIDDLVITAFGPGSDFLLDWFALLAGGGLSSSSDFELTSTIGQPVAGGMSGGDYAMEAGFWSIIGAVPPGELPLLRVTFAFPNSVIVSWPAPASGWVLQQSSTLGPSVSWTDVGAAVVVNGTDNTVTQAVAGGNRFYRLRHP